MIHSIKENERNGYGDNGWSVIRCYTVNVSKTGATLANGKEKEKVVISTLTFDSAVYYCNMLNGGSGN